MTATIYISEKNKNALFIKDSNNKWWYYIFKQEGLEFTKLGTYEAITIDNDYYLGQWWFKKWEVDFGYILNTPVIWDCPWLKDILIQALER